MMGKSVTPAPQVVTLPTVSVSMDSVAVWTTPYTSVIFVVSILVLKRECQSQSIYKFLQKLSNLEQSELSRYIMFL